MRYQLACVVIAMILLCCARSPARQIQQIAFVGCPADGQVGPIEPPQGTPRLAELDEIPAGEVAYYKGEHAPGVFAPSGWHCRVWYGSSGGFLVATPAPIEPSFPPAKFPDRAVEASTAIGGTSGRFAVATYALRLFREQAAGFIQNVKNEGTETARIVEGLQDTKDSVKSLTRVMAEFDTPANTTGLGTGDYLAPSQDSISGIAFLDEADSEYPNLSIIRVRLGAEMRQLKTVLMRLNKECIQKDDGC